MSAAASNRAGDGSYREDGNGERAGRFVQAMAARDLAALPGVLDAAKKCLVDWTGTTLGAREEGAAIATAQVARTWKTQGDAVFFMGGSGAAHAAALANGTMAHCLDFDDTHAASVAHFSSPTWAATLALGMDLHRSERQLLAAFIAGYEVGARLGGSGFGIVVNRRGFHSTGVFASLAAAAASASLLELDADGVQRALGAAATQTGGITASFGTMSKPFHAGKAALNGVLSAQLSQAGFVPSLSLLEPVAGLGHALVQDREMEMPRIAFDDGHWEITGNSFKPYACCLLAHASVDAARALREQVGGRAITAIEARVNPLAIQLAGKTAPRTPLEGKFSTAYCIALGLTGHAASQADFCDARLNDAAIQDLVRKTQLEAAPEYGETAACVRVTLVDGSALEQEIAISKGNPGNPMSWDDMHAKFIPLVEPAVGASAEALFDTLRHFERPGQLAKFIALVRRP